MSCVQFFHFKTFFWCFFLFQQKLRNAGLDLPEAGKKGAGPVEENKNLKEEVKTLKEELDNNKKGEEEEDGRKRSVYG